METPLRAARLSRNWSQLRVVVQLEALGAARGLPMPSRMSLKTQLSRWENGHVRPKEPYCSLLAEIYTVTPTELGLALVPAPMTLRSSIHAPLVTISRITADSVALMDELLRTYAHADNEVGPGYLRHVALQHVVQLEPLILGAQEHFRREGLRLCCRYSEFAGWLSQDAGDLDAAQHWTDRALDFVEEIRDRQLRSYVLMRKSGIAAERGDHARSVTLAVASGRKPRELWPRVRALSYRQQAISHALVRDGRASDRAAAEAVEAALEGDQAKGGEWAYATEAYVRMEAGLSAMSLHRYHEAAAQLSRAAASWPDGFARDQGLCLARLATVEAVRGNIDTACAVGRDSVLVTKVADSARTRKALVSLRRRLAPYDRLAFVSDFRRELASLG
jgi:transcriptional regulator with XRE-family HTH domain